MSYKPAFAADRTLGKLVKWLRLMGFDTVFEADVGSRQFQAICDTDRILLTRIRRMRDSTPKERVIWIKSNQVDNQIQQVIIHLKLEYSSLATHSRCLRCNEPLARINRDEAFAKVPDYIWETQTDFNHCRCCGRIYWPGSHQVRSQAHLRELFCETNPKSRLQT